MAKRKTTLPRFGYPALDALMDAIEAGYFLPLEFCALLAVKNDLMLLRNGVRTFARDGLPASRLADAVAGFFDAVEVATEEVSILMVERQRKGGEHGKH